MTKKDIDDLVQAFQKTEMSKLCTVCKAPSAGVGVFFPNDPQAYGAEQGKGRAFVYATCEACRRTPDKIEKKILDTIEASKLDILRN